MKRTLISLFVCLSILSILALPAAGVQAAPRFLSVSADSNAKSGQPGTSVIYNVAITNSGSVDDTVSISSTSEYPVGVTPQVVVPAGMAITVQVAVTIPSSASPGNSSAASLFFSGTPSGTSDDLLLLTTVEAPPSTLPERPAVVIKTYYADTNTPKPGTSFILFIELQNKGAEEARDVKLSFQGSDLLPQGTGGVVYVAELNSGSTKLVSQEMYISPSLIGYSVASLPVQMSYTDLNGVAFTEAFNITITLGAYAAGPTPTPTPTSTAQPIVRPQLVVGSYTTDMDPLQPGTLFSLEMEVRNLGNADARSVTVVLGGGATVDSGGTAQPGGTSGGSGDLATFAPVGSSNLVFLGDVAAGNMTTTNSKLIVNVSANPGAYQLKLSFVYSTDKGTRMVDDQVITLLVYRLPQLEINFYRDPNPLFAGQPNVLPVQITNLGRNSAVLGNLIITAENGEVQNNISLVGLLDPGGSYPWDATFIPAEAGDSSVTVTLNYTDDFNQPRQIVQSIAVSVQDSGAMGPDGGLGPNGEILGPDGLPIPIEPQPVQETFWQKVVRFFKGLFGLDSSAPQPVTPEGLLPSEGGASEGGPIIVPSGGGGKVP